MRFQYVLLAAIVASSCSSAKVSVPSKFSDQATCMPVKGINGWKINQKISFGTYQTSSIKRGWDFSSSMRHTKFGMNPEEAVLLVFGIGTDKRRVSQRGNYQYTLSNGELGADIFATEKFEQKDLVYASQLPWIGEASATQSYHYSFTAAILPATKTNNDPWSLVMINHYDRKKDTARKIFEQPYVEETGYATNGKENITIRPLRLQNMTTSNGKNIKMPIGSIYSGYELLWDGGVVAIIDILDNNIWLHNELDANDRLILSSISSAILLKRMQDVQQDKDELTRQ